MPKVRRFKPEGLLPGNPEQVFLTVDEVEAIRLADRDGLYQHEAAASMNVSRQTFGRIVESAHQKIAEAIVEGLEIVIEGGMIRQRRTNRTGVHDV